ncbi:MAG: FRG domain-containing protein [Saprospiraceae bacterium]|nr:FRG domain-containing protein [Saprospiraceae bacterium]
MTIIKTYQQYLDYIQEFRESASLNSLHPVFRGHAKDTYQISPTIVRDGLSFDKVLEFEKLILSKFKENIKDKYIGEIALNLPDDPSDPLYNWYCLMQARHLELPSRMIDWSMDHDTPLYFAINNEKYHGVDGHIWILASSMGNFDNLNGDPENHSKI